MHSIKTRSITVLLVVVLALALGVPLATASTVGVDRAQVAQASPLEVCAAKDTWVFASGGTNNGTLASLDTPNATGAGQYENVALEFDLSALPDGVTVTGVSLTIWIPGGGETNGTDESVLVSTTNTGWDEATVPFASVPPQTFVGSFAPIPEPAGAAAESASTTLAAGAVSDGPVGLLLHYDQSATHSDGLDIVTKEGIATFGGSQPCLTVTYTVGAVEPPPTNGEEPGDGGAPVVVQQPGPDMVNIPDFAVVGRVLSWTPVYYAPMVGAAGTVDLAPGTSLWIYGLDESRQFYLGVLAGKFFWLPVGTVGPNYDEVWQGRPLPTVVVDASEWK